MPEEAPNSVMIYEIKGQHPTDPGQENYRSLLSPDAQYFYWNQRKFVNLRIGDVVFVVNKTGGEVLHAVLDATGISTEYERSEDKTTFSDSDQVYEVGGQWDPFVRLKILQAIEAPTEWSWKTLGSSENTYLLGPHVSSTSIQNKILRAHQLRDLPDLQQPGKELLSRCIVELESLATGTPPPAPQPAPPEVTPQPVAADLLEVLKKYADEKIIFHSTERGAAYSITEYEPGKFQADRLDANEPVRISPEAYESKVTALAEHGGILPFTGFASPVALKNTLIQSRSLALTADRQNVVDVSDSSKRLKHFCAILENLRVSTTPEGPKLYKPAMLACVIDAIDQGQLTENKITFDFIAPRFIKKMEELGVEATEENAAQPFYHLTGDLIWFHAVKDVHDPMKDGREGPAAARSKVEYALLKDTFWDLLQDWNAIRAVRATLERKWFSAQPTATFWWVTQGKSYSEEREAGFIQAPKETPGEPIKFYWNNVTKVKSGDIIFHYSKGAIRAISVASSEPFDVDAGAVAAYPDRVRVRVETTYHDLDPVLERDRVGPSLANLPDSYSPIDRNGEANQGYLFELSENAVAIIKSQLNLKDLPEPLRRALSNPANVSPTPPMLTSDFIREASKAIRASGLIYPDDLLRRFAFSLLAKPFVLLTGTSGTGKTQLALKFAQWLVGKEGYELVPVGADWTDNRQVLGHYNPFEGKFISTCVLDLILRARETPNSPFFLILDEMNLSHVERYFADFLSAMESGDPISLHRNGLGIETAKGTPVEEEIKIPRNLFVIGTVNIDETTYMFSPKVLDRANVIEFSLTRKDLIDYMTDSGSGLSTPIPAPADRGEAFVSFLGKPRNKETLAAALKEDLKATRATITDLFSLLEGSSMEFGFRTPSEFLKYCEIAHDLSENGEWSCYTTCDVQILQKVLPKLHGSRRRIERLLVGLASYCSNGDLEQAEKYTSGKSAPSHFKLEQAAPRFPESFAKLCKMIGVVQRDQFVSFIQ